MASEDVCHPKVKGNGYFIPIAFSLCSLLSVEELLLNNCWSGTKIQFQTLEPPTLESDPSRRESLIELNNFQDSIWRK